MAVDTAAKRFSMMNFGKGAHLVVMMPPSGTVGQGARQHFLDCYGGIFFDGAVVSTGRSLLLQLGGG